jgi:hypothetical protein
MKDVHAINSSIGCCTQAPAGTHGSLTTASPMWTILGTSPLPSDELVTKLGRSRRLSAAH